MFGRNVGNLDRIFRIVIGLVALSMVFVGPQSLWGLIGLVPLLTGLAGRCPAYMPFGLSTCPLRK